MNEIKRADFRHFFTLSVRWGDLDVLGHVNNTVFYRYSEEGRINYFQDVGLSEPTAMSSGPILADLRCRFVQQLRYPASIEIATRTQALGNSSIRIQQALFHEKQQELIAGFDAVVVWFDYQQQSSAATPEAVRAAIRKLEIVAPEE